MRYQPIPSILFKDRRADFAKKMEPGSIAIFHSNDEMRRTGDQFYPFRQDSSLFSLTGIDQPGTILVLFPDSKKKIWQEIIFILPSDPTHAIWNGERLTAAQAKKISGIQTIRMTDEWETILKQMLQVANSVYVRDEENEKSPPAVLSRNDRMAAELKRKYPHHTFHHALPALKQMMMVKHPLEIELLQKAIHVTSLAFDHILHHLKPGMMEYQAEAELTYVLAKNGCRHAFDPIVASGASACILHYITNDHPIADGSLVLLDFGAEYACMASDISRTIPASGMFSKDQKKYYNAVLRVLNETMQMMRPGVKITQLNKEAGKLVESELINLRILTRHDVRRQDPAHPAWKKYFMHGISHHLGYDVHDIAEKNALLKTGMVLTCEPGIYIPQLKLGIRLENDVLITRKGPKNLMATVPIEADEIESIMHS